MQKMMKQFRPGLEITKSNFVQLYISGLHSKRTETANKLLERQIRSIRV